MQGILKGEAENKDHRTPLSVHLKDKELPDKVAVGLSGPVPVNESSRPGEFKIHASHINRGPASNFAIIISNPDPSKELTINILEGGIFNEYYQSPKGIVSTPYNHLSKSSQGQNYVKEFKDLNPYSGSKPTSSSEGFSAGFMLENPGSLFGEIPKQLIIPPGKSGVLDSRRLIKGDQAIVDIRGQASGDFHVSFLNMSRKIQSKSAIINQFQQFKENQTFLPRHGNVFKSTGATGSKYWRRAGYGRIFAITRGGDCHAEKKITLYPKEEVSGIGTGYKHGIKTTGTNLASFLIGADGRTHEGVIESTAEGIAPFPKPVQIRANTKYLWNFDENGNEMLSKDRYRQYNISDRSYGDYHAKYKFRLNIDNKGGAKKTLYLKVGPSDGYHDNIRKNQTIYQGPIYLKINNELRKFNISFTKASGEVEIPFNVPEGKSKVEISASSVVNSTPVVRLDIVDKQATKSK